MSDLRLDWFEATLECETVSILAVADIVTEGTGSLLYEKGRHGYSRRIEYNSSEFSMTILDTGNGGWPHMVCTGQNANTGRRIARMLGCVGRITRLDIACDSLEGWLPAEKRVLQWADDHPKTTLLSVGDFYRGLKGRTYYIGAAQSQRRIRVYEKGIQLGENPEWVRVEMQYRPKTREEKTWAFDASLEELADSSKAFVFTRALEGFYTPPHYVRSGREPIVALARQYGRALQAEVPDAYRLIVEYLKRDWRPSDHAADSSLLP